MLSSVQEEIFRGKLLRKWRWLAFALEVQYGSFFDDASSFADVLAVHPGWEQSWWGGYVRTDPDAPSFWDAIEQQKAATGVGATSNTIDPLPNQERP